MSNAIIGMSEFLICLVMFLGSLAMLILGLVKRIRGLWIAGTIAMGVTMLIAVVATLVLFGISRNMSHTEDYEYATDVVEPGDVIPETFTLTPYTDSLMKVQFEVPVDYSWETEQGAASKTPLFAHKKMKTKGIELVRLKGIDSEVGQENSVVVVLKLNRDYRGRLLLEGYDHGEMLAASWSQKFEGKAGKEIEISFQFDQALTMQDLYYCTLTAFE